MSDQLSEQDERDASSIENRLFEEIRKLIEKAKQRSAVAVNEELTLLYWQVGRRIQDEVLKGQRSEYGKRAIASLSERLTNAYGRGWSEKQLRHCLRLVETFPDDRIVYTLCRQLSWSHLRLLMYMDDSLKRDFYIEIAQLEHWSVRQLQDRIRSMLYERTAISKQPEETIQQDLQTLREEGTISADLAFRDPYILDFLGLADRYS